MSETNYPIWEDCHSGYYKLSEDGTYDRYESRDSHCYELSEDS